tara:strand:+ start:52000 stop:53526 length:1527 start_codon:yes stop_codon:yes gene_type:complete
MSYLKSAYELGLERIIASKYGDEIRAQEEAKHKQEVVRRSKLPGYVVDWEKTIAISEEDSVKEKEEEVDMGSVMVEDTQSKLYTKAEISQKQNGNNNIDSNQDNIIPAYVHNPVKEFVPKPKVESMVDVKQDMKEVHWYGHFHSYTGFSRMNRAFAFGLSNKGVAVKADIEDGPIEINEATQNQLNQLKAMKINPSAPKIFGATVPITMFHGGHKIAYTMMETSKSLHKDYVEKLNLFDEVWVPTHQGKELFRSNGVRPPIYVMPLGVDTQRYNPYQKSKSFCQTKGFTFLSVFKWGQRKGYDILLKSYLEEFSSADDTTLLLVSRVHSPHEKGRILEEVNYYLESSGIPQDELPHVALYDQEVLERDMPKLYRSCQAFVLISRGEGYAFPYYEAAACGLPIIGSYCSGQKDLFDAADGAYLVEPEDYVKVGVNGPLAGLAKHCNFYDGQYFPTFGEKTIEKVQSHMRDVYENYDEALENANELSQYVLNNCSWDHAIDKVYKRIEEL